MNALTERWMGLSRRERLIVGFGGIAALAIVLHALVWQPWQDELARLRSTVPAKEQTLKWMRAQAVQVNSLQQRLKDKSSTSGLPLLTLVERSANQAEMREAITRMSPGDKTDQVRVWMDDVAFDRWLQWVELLSDSGVEVAEANIDRSEENLVGIRVTLQR